MLTEDFYKFTKKFVDSDMQAIKRGAEAYINASRTGSLCCLVKSVSKSGMSRKLDFISIEIINDSECAPYYFGYFLGLLGYRNARNYYDTSVTVRGCGMDMVFHTHYKIINTLCDFGFITESERNVLRQKTPHTL